ncbi:MAG: peptidylprolyl isomerase [Bacillota bacterium]|nr:peptidylprolyl isomerase [Bacillota bacterium]
MKKFISSLILSFLSILLLAGCASKAPTTPQTPTSGQTQSQQNQSVKPAETNQTAQPTNQAKPKTWSSPPTMQIDQNKPYHAMIHTNLGDISIKLFPNDAPKTVNNFVFLARNHFYDGLKFHRVIKDFMIQTGDPNGNGTGGPGYKFADELSSKHTYAPGVVAMANAGPNTNGSQFFIGSGQSVANLNQNPNYTIFGQVDAGMDVVAKIASVRVGPSASGEVSSPLDQVYMKSVDILEK